ncbi:hypothetical protein X975_20889, partial [Stegodyphus mimosarum]
NRGDGDQPIQQLTPLQKRKPSTSSGRYIPWPAASQNIIHKT